MVLSYFDSYCENSSDPKDQSKPAKYCMPSWLGIVYFMKLLKTSNIDTVKYYQEFFGFDLPSVLWTKRMQNFEVKFALYLSN